RFYAAPYALAYADSLKTVRRHLWRAAGLIAAETPDFAAYLKNRSRDLASGDYESGDASWVSGDFDNLNIQIGAYETYDDNLMGVKAFFSASILARDSARSQALEKVMTELQAIENALPYAQHKSVRSRIPVGVYNVVADFGQARGANTATILPNDANHARKYGRTILIRNNLLSNPQLFKNSALKFRAAVATSFADHLSADGKFNRTLWHEVGHYLGVSQTADGDSLSLALAERADLFEELKSDLVSLFAAPQLLEAGYYDADGLRSQYADGVRRTLQIVQPRAEQPYQSMQLMQFNYFMEHGLLGAETDSGRLTIDYERYSSVVRDMLAEVLNIQYAGDADAAQAFVERWNYWDERIHGRLAKRMRDAIGYRKTMVNYRALSQ
ncbi:MAG: NUDIX hydrolase, partial [Gammaproteobacteria bacterium]|nr:NUDIX hydrolase [Gammaproteobacteria bacterium]